MKKQIKKKALSSDFFKSPGIRAYVSRHRAAIEAKSEYFHFLETLARIRKEEGITQKQLSDRTKIGQDELSRIERGQKNITLETYHRILNGLGYSAEVKYHKNI